MAEAIPAPADDGYPLPAGLQPTSYLGPVSSCPPEYAGMPVRDVIAQIDVARQNRATAAEQEVLAAGFRSRTPAAAAEPGTGFESGGVLDVGAPDAVLAGLTDSFTRDGRLAELDDDELIGVMRAWKRLESWCSASLLTTVAGFALAIVTHNHSWLIMSIVGLGLSFLQIRHQRREAAATGSGADQA